MRQLRDIGNDLSTTTTIVELTQAFEGLASMRIAQTKSKVLQAQSFFEQLWQIYTQLRVDSLFRFGRTRDEKAINKQLFLLISSSGGFSGDIDQRLINEVLKTYDPNKHDIIVIGHHAVILLGQAGVKYKKYFKLPEKDDNLNVEPVLQEVRQYKSTMVFYQTYDSLMQQSVKQIELSAAVKALGEKAGSKEETISEQNYIIEPDSFTLVAHIERSMSQIALIQVIFDSKLAQYASRFRAMTVANDRASDLKSDLTQQYNRTRRAKRDQQLKETTAGLMKANRL